MIFVGTDIVEVSRIRKLIDSKGDRFLSHIYDKIEVEYCSIRVNPALHYAGRFSAKEAVKKALLSSGLFDYILLKDIVISRDISGAPSVIFPRDISEKGSVNVSISHTDNYATATAIFQLKP
jgi:holo-[acyl-carrier protein] synthase